MRKYMNSYGSFLYLGSLVGLVAILLLVSRLPKRRRATISPIRRSRRCRRTLSSRVRRS